jgi:hypothetical protein
MVVEPEESEASAAGDQEAVSRLLDLADKMIELSQQERKRLDSDVETPETQEDLQGTV